MVQGGRVDYYDKFAADFFLREMTCELFCASCYILFVQFGDLPCDENLCSGHDTFQLVEQFDDPVWRFVEDDG